MKKSLSCLLLCLCAGPLPATEDFVSPSGSDAQAVAERETP